MVKECKKVLGFCTCKFLVLFHYSWLTPRLTLSVTPFSPEGVALRLLGSASGSSYPG